MTNVQLLHLTSWITQRGWKLTYALGRDTLTGKAYCSATAGPVTGQGRNANEALEQLQTRLVEVASCPRSFGDSGAGSGVAPPEPKAAA